MTVTQPAQQQTKEVFLGPVDAIPIGAGLAYDADGTQIAVFRTRLGRVFAMDAVCTHAGGPIADGQADETVVLCPLHLNVFELATGCSRSGQPDLATYPVRVDQVGQLLVTVAGT
jgi:nitrite reductase/ring-hydroxylating ferredoxin subunit